MSCGHRRRFWSPVEGTINGAIAFSKNPEQHGFCEICRAVAAEREACAQIAESFIVEGEHLVQLTAREIAAAIRARQAR